MVIIRKSFTEGSSKWGNPEVGAPEQKKRPMSI